VKLVHYWPFDNNVNDSIGNAHLYDGVQSSFTTDRFNRNFRALSLNSGYYKIPSGIYFDGSDFTFTSWVKIKQQVNYARIFEVANGENLDAVVFAVHNDTPCFSFSSATTFTELYFSQNHLQINVWHHLTFIYQYPTSKLYLNGTLTDTTNTTFTIQSRLET